MEACIGVYYVVAEYKVLPGKWESVTVKSWIKADSNMGSYTQTSPSDQSTQRPTEKQHCQNRAPKPHLVISQHKDQQKNNTAKTGHPNLT